MVKFYCVKLRAVALFFGMLFFSSMTYASAVEYIEVDAKGTGETRAKAISEALVEAVSKVNGLSLAAQDVATIKLEISALEAITRKEVLAAASTTAEQSVDKQVMTATRGMIQSYNILSEEPSSLQPGWIDVRLTASIAKHKLSEQTQRKRIAVLPFRFSNAARGFEIKYAEFVAQGVVNYLSQTGRFAVLDRDFIAEKHAEFHMLEGDDVPIVEKARVGNTLGADYIVVGAIDMLNGKITKEKVPYIKDMQTTFNAEARMTWRIIEAATGMVMLSDTVVEKQKEKVLQSEKDQELPSIRSLAQASAELIGKRIIDTIYPLMVVSYSGDSVTIGQGGDTLQVGQRFNLIQYGEVLIDPYTKEAIGRQEQSVGVVEVTSVLPKSAQAKVIESRITAEKFTHGSIILREVVPPEAENKKPVTNTMQPKW